MLSNPVNPLRWGAEFRNGETTVRIWAPGAAEVLLETPGNPGIPMAAGADGWHSLQTTALPPRALYRFALCGIAVADPASRCQPSGPRGWSEVTDPAAYQWSDGEWRGRPWHETVLYELHIGTFSQEGTFLGAIAHLDDLADLGITAIELMPIATFPGSRNWGYDGVLPYAPQHSYGPPDDLKRLVEECHLRGISVILDVVYNHFGPDANMIGVYAPGFFTNRHKTPWGAAIDFDGDHSVPVREFFIQNAVYWIEEFHMDGLRLDAVQAVFDQSRPHILDEIARRVREASLGRQVHLMLENDNNDAAWLDRRDGTELAQYDAQWNDDFHHVMRVLMTGRTDGYYADYATRPLHRLGRTLAEGFSYQGEESTHRKGFIRGTPSAHLPPTAFVNFLQNHDQVGNTPFGLRLTELAPPAAMRLGTAVLLLSPTIPMLFMGQEWGSTRPFDFFCDYGEPLAGLVRQGRRDEFSHLPEFANPDALGRLTDPNAASTSNGCVLDWANRQVPEHAEWLAFHRNLLDIRRERVVPLLPDMSGGAGWFQMIGLAEPGACALEVTWHLADGRRLILAINPFDEAVAWRTPDGETLFTLSPEPMADILRPWDARLVVAGPSIS